MIDFTLQGIKRQLYNWIVPLAGYDSANDKVVPIKVDSDGNLQIEATINAGDIEIGAVELKNASSDDRASIEAANTARTTGTKVLAVQHVDATGAVLPAVPVLGAGSASIGGAKDNGPHWTPTRTHTASADMTTAAAITAAPTAGQKIVADDILISSDTAMSFTIEMETSGTDLAKVFLPANGTVQVTLRDGLKGDTADKKLYGKASVAGNVAITACYHSEA